MKIWLFILISLVLAFTLVVAIPDGEIISIFSNDSINNSVSYTANSITICDEYQCVKKLYSSTTYTEDLDGKWKRIDKAKSLKKSNIKPKIDSDGVHLVDVLDYNFTSIDVVLNVSGWKLVDLKKYAISYYDLDNQKLRDLAEDITSWYRDGDLIYATLDYNITEIIHFGEESTTIQLNDNVTENLGDTWVSESAPSDNYGSDNDMKIETEDGGRNYTTYIKFNTSGLNNSFYSSQLCLFLISNTAEEGDFWNLSLFNTSSDWDEDTMNWTNQPETDYANGYITSRKYIDDGVTNLNVWECINITNSSPNIDYSADITAFRLWMWEAGKVPFDNDEHGYATKEHSNVSRRPYLEIIYGVPPPPQVTPTTPTSILCDGGDCNGTFYTSMNIQCDGSTDGNNDTITYKLEANNVTPSTYSEKTFFEGWESGSLTANWSVYESDSGGRQTYSTTYKRTGTYGMMLDRTPSGTYTLNEMITEFDFTGTTQMVLDLYFWDQGDETNTPSDHSGHQNSDGIFFTCDGSYWRSISGLVGSASWTNININITQDSDWCGTLDSNFALKFTQYDNFPVTSDGIGFDDITITYISGNPEQNDWTELGNHTDGNNLTWSFTINNTYENIRCKATDVNGSQLWSAYYNITNDTTVYTSAGSPPAGDTCTCPDSSSTDHIFDLSDNCIVNECLAQDIYFIGSGWITCNGTWNIRNLFGNVSGGLLNGTSIGFINISG